MELNLGLVSAEMDGQRAGNARLRPDPCRSSSRKFCLLVLIAAKMLDDGMRATAADWREGDGIEFCDRGLLHRSA